MLDRAVESMTEFKQIVGRGTRVHEDTHKFYFTLMDFRGATSHLPTRTSTASQCRYTNREQAIHHSPDHAPRTEDGEAPLPPEPADDETIVEISPGLQPDAAIKSKVYVDGIDATIIAQRVQYLDEHGKLVTESLRDFTKKALKKRFASLDDFLKRWKAAERKQAVIDELAAEGLGTRYHRRGTRKNLDPFDLICHVAFDAKPLTRRERAANVQKRNVFRKYGYQARTVLNALLDKYADEGVLNLDDANVLRIPPLNTLGTPVQLLKAFGGKDQFIEAVRDLQSALYQETA